MNINRESVSKSEQIIASVTEAIRSGELIPGQAIPSINKTATSFGVARKTVVRAYDKLKSSGLIESRPKTGYFVINKKPNHKLKVLLIFHSFEGHWESLYNSFREQVADTCEIDIYFHHYNSNVLELVITRNLDNYDLFIISSFNHPRVKAIIGRIPAYKVLLVSRMDRLDKSYNHIVQDFYEGTYTSLLEAKEKIQQYKRFILSYPEREGHSNTLKDGFVRFCSTHGFNPVITDTLKNAEIRRGDAFLLISDNDLIQLLNVCKIRNWQLGKDIGVLAYNETPLKAVIRDGISVISCNFMQMADEMAAFIKERKTVKRIIPIEFIERNSI